MPKRHKFQTNFSGGVISENAFGRVDTELYQNALSQGENIIIENPGGAARRPGTLFVKEFEEDFVKLLPFSFNSEQNYLLAWSNLKLDIFLNDADEIPELVASLVTLYTKEELKEFDYAQSADTMVLTHTNHPTQGLRRLGSNIDWEILPIPFVNPPQELICADGAKPFPDGTCSDDSTPTLIDVWGPLNGYPKYCTFFQGRLYLAGARLLPQHVWGSVIHDFFNFDIGTGEDAEAIYDILDTDFINPIVAIYAEKTLFVFSTGDEFVNAAEVITPAASAWQRVSKNGSFGTIHPVSLDGGVLYLDRSGRTIRTLTFNDSIKAFDSQSVSMYSEDLIINPTDMGIMKGSLFQASNFLYVVNATGTIAVLNLSRAANMAAWTVWKTQGAFKDVLTFNNEITYALVERRGKWILEKLSNSTYVDSGSRIINRIELIQPDPVTYNDVEVTYFGQTVTYGFEAASEANSDAVIGDRNNFYGISLDTRGYGRVVIVINGVEVYKDEQFRRDPQQTIYIENRLIKSVNIFAQDNEAQDEYFEHREQTEFYLYSMLITTQIDFSQNYIDGLPHLIGREVVMNLDGSTFKEQLVVPGDQLPGGGLIKSYPDDVDWLFDETPGSETYILRYLDTDLVTTLIEGYYQGTKYGPLEEDDFWNAFPITQSGEPVVGDEFLEQGIFVSESDGRSIFDIDGSYTVPLGVTQLQICIIGGGGSGAAGDDLLLFSKGGGFSGEIISKTINVLPNDVILVGIGLGGLAQNIMKSNGNAGTATTFGADSAVGGVGGTYSESTPNIAYPGNFNERVTCAGTYRDGVGLPLDPDFYLAAGGQAGFENGGNAGVNSIDNLPSSGQAGSGGGGLTGTTINPIVATSGKGGNGRAIISFSNTVKIRKYRIRKMKLLTASVPITDGVVITPRTFLIGQAGLYYGVTMETLPFNGGELTNEPKRIVSVMARFVNTAGLNIGNNIIPERDFGEMVLDEAPPKKSGIQKIRLFGYTRETTLRITQYDPLPMTLTSLDIEIMI